MDTLLQISALLRIYKALTVLFEDENQALGWLKRPHQAPLFAGTSPLACMLTGGHDGLMAVRQCLDAWRANTTGSGGLECQFESVIANDLHFI
ncbi:MAG: MbcA/ParS/Xre antitoxin family protein [Sulfitobacter sp.]